MALYPLKFHPRFVEKIWGGRRLATLLDKALPADKSIGESWELYDFPPGVVEGSADWVSSVVSNGPLAGRTLHALIEEFGTDLLGDVPLTAPHGQFPLLVKFLDAREDLSLQVHPDRDYANSHPPAAVKDEAWYVVAAEEGSVIYKGFKGVMTRPVLQAAVADGTILRHIQTHAAKSGRWFYLPSGTVHALGAGIVVAEVQTPSDTTFRLFDFNRVDAAGRPRQLHVDEALACADFSPTAAGTQPRSHVGGLFTTVSRLVTAPAFTLEKVRFIEGVDEEVPYDEPVVWVMLEGTAEVRVNGVAEATRVTKGQTVLFPAGMVNPRLKTLADCVWLEATFPTRPELG